MIDFLSKSRMGLYDEYDGQTLSDLCLPGYNFFTCPLWETKVMMLVQLLLVAACCYFFSAAIFGSGSKLRVHRKSFKNVQFWAIVTISMVINSMASVFPQDIILGTQVDGIIRIYQTVYQYAYLILAEQSVQILTSIRFRFSNVIKYVTIGFEIANTVILVYLMISFIFNPMLWEKNMFFFALTCAPMYVDSIIKAYVVVVLCLAFVFNDSVEKYMPSRYLGVMKGLIFTTAFMPFLKLAKNIEGIIGDIYAMLDIWCHQDIENRMRTRISVAEFLDISLELVSLFALAVSMICLTQVDFVENRSKKVLDESFVNESSSTSSSSSSEY